MRTSEPTLPKKKVLAALKQMPENVELDDLFDRLLLLAKVERGLVEATAGKGFSTADARKKVTRWSK